MPDDRTTPNTFVPPERLQLTRAVVAAATLTVLALGIMFAGQGSASAVDRGISDWLRAETHGYHRSLDVLVNFGGPPAVVIGTAVLTTVALGLRRRRLALLVLLGPAVTGIATTVLKEIIGRTMYGNLSMPSGHTGGITSLGLLAALMIAQVSAKPNSIVRFTSMLLVGLITSTMGVALIAIDVHYPTDVLGGLCTAVAVVGVLALAFDRWGRYGGVHRLGLSVHALRGHVRPDAAGAVSRSGRTGRDRRT